MEKRFEIMAKSEVLVLVPEKTAIRIECHYGKPNQLPEVVIAELYWKEGTWAYTRSQIRFESSPANCTFILDGVKSTYQASKKVKKETASPVVTSDIATLLSALTPEQVKALLAGIAKPADPVKDAELVFDASLSRKGKGKGKK